MADEFTTTALVERVRWVGRPRELVFSIETVGLGRVFRAREAHIYGAWNYGCFHSPFLDTVSPISLSACISLRAAE